MQDQLLLAQENLEDKCLSLGVDRFRSHNLKAESKGRMSEHGAARRLLREGVEPLTKAIAFMIDPERFTGGRGGRQHRAVKWCRLIGADTAAYITLKVLIDGMALPKHAVSRASRDISGRILDELRYRRFKRDAKGLFDYTVRQFGEKKTSHYKHKKRVLDNKIRRATVRNAEGEQVPIDVSDLVMTSGTMISVGAKLLDLAVTVTGLVEVQSIRVAPKGPFRNHISKNIRQDLRLRPTEETMAWLDKANGYLEVLLPVTLPMVVPPLPWDPKRKGGYLYALRDAFDLTRQFPGGDGPIEAPMPEVYAALNIVQNTEWCINKDVHGLATLLREKEVTVPGFPSWENLPMPPRPDDIATNKEARGKWKTAAGKVRDENYLLFVRRMEVAKIMEVGDTMLEHARIYFPHRLDFRGRMYPIPNYLNPQGSDLAKGLLMFSNGKPLDGTSAAALAIHGANCMDDDPFDGLKLSKVSLNDRMHWTVRHAEAICEVATAPLDHRWWMQADKPFQFYAFCCEWKRYMDEGDAFVSRLPVAIDGSCNGHQHFAAMLRDEASGKSVNLMPSKVPEDLYQAVADKVADMVLREATGGNEKAQGWVKSKLITRKLCKRPTMTFGYGSKRWGFGEQTMKYLQTEGLDCIELAPDLEKPYRTQLYESCNYLAGIIWDALGEVALSASSTMAWLQGITRKVVKDTNESMYWTTPSGFPVKQDYFLQEKSSINTIINGKVVRPTVYTDTKDVVVHKHTNSVAPNFVHSLDAAAMVLAIISAHAKGVESFGMVHDSYATVAEDIGKMGDATRETFVQMYEDHDVIQEFYESCRRAYSGDPDKLPKPPRRGDLDLKQVLDSDYFFA